MWEQWLNLFYKATYKYVEVETTCKYVERVCPNGKRSWEVPKSSPLMEENVSDRLVERNMMLGVAYKKLVVQHFVGSRMSSGPWFVFVSFLSSSAVHFNLTK